ncbi:polysaccharide deacetylase family protein [Microbacterium radiodurans]|uniref:Polysaccharide deacetylase family protein n=1 Tax=Microbacterium radiodurans TaxID=661398 RepID=A0A5J5IY09_9MICO|nr:polysaccharide deacetylase family protein [Microbacterium radiodurans]KAA9089440.1 polysaccharide deacetylase family protein [Microbacterium radiodurans]
MAATRRSTSRRQQRRRRILIGTITGAVVAAVAVAAVGVVTVLQRSEPPSAPAAGDETPAVTTPTPTPDPTPLTPAQQLLAGTTDPAACAVSFAGEGIDLAPLLESQGSLYASLPIPTRDGEVFAGWYATPDDAAARAIPGRINGADAVACDAQQRTLYGSWMSPADNEAAKTRIPILMYHQFTTKPEGESGWLRGNYAYVGDWDAHLAYISEQQFYLPTWPELSAFIDGALYLPDHSVIVTDDDADPSWLELAVPLVEKHQVMTTSFVITVNGPGPDLTPYVLKRSHTHDMHTAGDNGQGRIVNWSKDQIVTDLDTSASVLGGTKEVVAYPFGHYNETAKEGVAAAGFEMARTIEQGYVSIGTDKLALPCIRINYGMTVDDLKRAIG